MKIFFTIGVFITAISIACIEPFSFTGLFLAIGIATIISVGVLAIAEIDGP